MSGIPILGTWATLANYPAGGNPWNGNPTKTAPAFPYFTPGTGASALEVNYELNQLFTQDAAILQLANPVGDWQPTLTWSGSNGPYTILWNDYQATQATSQQWIISTFTGGNILTYYGTGGDAAVANWTRSE